MDTPAPLVTVGDPMADGARARGTVAWTGRGALHCEYG